VRRPKLLVCTDWFPPGYRAGGPIRSTANLVAAMQECADVRVVTSNTDFGSDEPYPGITPNTWLPYGLTAQVMYLTNSDHTWVRITNILEETDADRIYLNSMFSTKFTLAPLWHAWRGGVSGRVVIAPRGMLHRGALRFKATKKRAFLAVMRAVALCRKVSFHATDDQEREDIHVQLGISSDRIRMLPNLPEPPVARVVQIGKTAGHARMLYLARITPKKALLSLLQAAARVPATLKLDLTVAGPIEDVPYWDSCRRAIEALPSHVAMRCLDAVPHDQVRGLLEDHHFYVLPTLGENYGHGIIEALGTGRPVIISDQTPWRGLQAAGVGWDVNIDDTGAFQSALLAATEMNQSEYDSMSAAAWAFAKQRVANPAVIEGYRQMVCPA
jgi:glycosyltransferase involved in cell wall biosynthesis